MPHLGELDDFAFSFQTDSSVLKMKNSEQPKIKMAAKKDLPKLNYDVWCHVFDYLRPFTLHTLGNASKEMRSMVATYSRHKILTGLPSYIREEEKHWLINPIPSEEEKRAIRKKKSKNKSRAYTRESPDDTLEIVVDPIINHLFKPMVLPLEETRWLFIHAQWGNLFCAQCCDIAYEDMEEYDTCPVYEDYKNLRRAAQTGRKYKVKHSLRCVMGAIDSSRECTTHWGGCPNQSLCSGCSPRYFCCSPVCESFVCEDALVAMCEVCGDSVCVDCIEWFGGSCEACNEGWFCDSCVMEGSGGCGSVFEQVRERLIEDGVLSDDDAEIDFMGHITDDDDDDDDDEEEEESESEDDSDGPVWSEIDDDDSDAWTSATE